MHKNAHEFISFCSKFIKTKNEKTLLVLLQKRTETRAFSLFTENNVDFTDVICDIRHFFGIWFGLAWFSIV